MPKNRETGAPLYQVSLSLSSPYLHIFTPSHRDIFTSENILDPYLKHHLHIDLHVSLPTHPHFLRPHVYLFFCLSFSLFLSF